MSKRTQAILVHRPRPMSFEHRSGVRQLCALRATWRLFTTSMAISWPATVRDMSTGGLSLILDDPCEQRTLVVMLCSPDGETSFSKMVRVKYCAPDNSGHWVLGGNFAKPLSEEELDRVLIAGN